MVMESARTPRSRTAAQLPLRFVAPALAFLFTCMSLWRNAKVRAGAVGAAFALLAMSLAGSAFAQMTGNGQTNPDAIINTAVCGANGWLTWFTSTKFLVVLLVAGLIGFFLGRAIGKRDNDGIMGTFVAVAGLGAIRILVKIVTTC